MSVGATILWPVTVYVKTPYGIWSVIRSPLVNSLIRRKGARYVVR